MAADHTIRRIVVAAVAAVEIVEIGAAGSADVVDQRIVDFVIDFVAAEEIDDAAAEATANAGSVDTDRHPSFHLFTRLLSSRILCPKSLTSPD